MRGKMGSLPTLNCRNIYLFCSQPLTLSPPNISTNEHLTAEYMLVKSRIKHMPYLNIRTLTKNKGIDLKFGT